MSTADQLRTWTSANALAKSVYDEEQREAEQVRKPVRTARFELVRTDAGWHSRFVGANNRTVWSTEVYTRRENALAAIALLDTEAAADAALPEFIRAVNETTAYLKDGQP